MKKICIYISQTVYVCIYICYILIDSLCFCTICLFLLAEGKPQGSDGALQRKKKVFDIDFLAVVLCHNCGIFADANAWSTLGVVHNLQPPGSG